MSQQHTTAGFQTTQWSVVVAAAGDARLLEPLLASYWGPIYAFIRRSGRSREQAADLAQQFVAEVVLERGLLEKACPERGRFRTFLKAALRNFLVDQHRRSVAKGRSPSLPVGGSAALDRLEPAEDGDPGDAFDRQWATTLLSITLERLASECAAAGQAPHWDAFRAAVIDPALGHDRAPAMEALAERLGVDSPTKVSSMIQTVRRKFRRTLRQVVEETTADAAAADDEIASLRRFLGA
ncbi:MAG: hypothetical protein WD749_00795 [Phycisphaerales bacterium]